MFLGETKGVPATWTTENVDAFRREAGYSVPAVAARVSAFASITGLHRSIAAVVSLLLLFQGLGMKSGPGRKMRFGIWRIRMGKNRCRICTTRKAHVCNECLEEMRVIEPPPWTPFLEAQVDFDDSVQAVAFEDCKVYRNSRYQVALRDCGDGPFGPMVHLSIKRIDRLPIRDWRDLQRIKNELVGEDAEAVELFPMEKRTVDTSNQYHLWVFPEFEFPFGFVTRAVTNGGGVKGARQRKHEGPFRGPVKDPGNLQELVRRAQLSHVVSGFIGGRGTVDEVIEKLKRACGGDRDLLEPVLERVEDVHDALGELRERFVKLVTDPWEKKED
jgi:hypothetical protein